MEGKSEGVRLHPHTLAGMLQSYLSDLNFTRKLTKRERVLIWLIVCSRANHKATRFDAEAIGDHCLHSTISDIGRVCGLAVQREFTKRPGRFGKIDCCQYWLEGEDLEKAENLISGKFTRRAA